MKRALIFGVGGQDGSYLSELLLGDGYRVIGVIRRASLDNTGRLAGVLGNNNFSLVEGDITDSCFVYRIVATEAPDEIYNLAAQSHVATSFVVPEMTWNVNASGALNVFEAARLYGGKVYQASSSEMFGKNFDGLSGTGWQDENTKFAPTSPYAVSKVAAHQLGELYREAYGVFVACGILFNHESPRRGEKFVTRKVTKYLGGDRKEKLKLGNLDAYRDWGHSKDYMRAAHMMLQREVPDTFVIATGVTVSVRDFVRAAFIRVGLNMEDYVEIDPSLVRPSEVPFLRGKSTKAREELGWLPEYDLERLVEEMLLADGALS